MIAALAENEGSYAKKVNLFIALAPITTLQNVDNTDLS
jgi:hypothetical protein